MALIQTPFLLLHNNDLNMQSVEELQNMNNAHRVPIPLQVYFLQEHVASILGVGQSGSEYIMEKTSRNVFSGFGQFVNNLVEKRGVRTRNARSTCETQIFVSLNGFKCPLNEWKNNCLGWAQTHVGVVVLINASINVPKETVAQEVQHEQQPRGIIRLPEPPMQFGDDGYEIEMVHEISDDEMSWMDEQFEAEDRFFQQMENEENAFYGRGTDENTKKEVTECTICYGPLTKNLKAPCGVEEHQICGECLGRHACNWNCHCVSASTPFVSCPHEGCDGQYTLKTIQPFISEKNMTTLVEKINHFQRRQTVSFACPRCHEISSVNSEFVKDRPVGTLAVKCQNQNCGLEVCYHCLDAVPMGSASRSQSLTGIMHPLVCHHCANAHEFSPPRAGQYNRFVPKANCVSIIPRNYELNIQDCIRQLTAICNNKTMVSMCRVCNTPIHRSSACSEITHCGIRQCTICGMSGLEFESHLLDHWQSTGLMNTCPRWMTDDFWHMVLPHIPDSGRCVEGVCHSDTHDCCCKQHENFRNEVVEVRRVRHFRGLLRSLPGQLQTLVIEKIIEMGEANVNPLKEVLDRIRLAREYGNLL